MARNRDLFEDSTMSFGEHLEVLRVHVWRALIGMIVGVLVCLFIGDRLVEFLRQPIDDALRRNNMAEITNDVSKTDFFDFVTKWWNDELPNASDVPEEPTPDFADNELLVEVPVDYAIRMIEEVAPGTIANDPPQAEPPDSDTPASDNEEAAKPEVPTIQLLIRSDEIALWRATAERFNKPVALKVEEAFLTYIKVSVVAGFAMTSPWIFYQIWLFVAAGLFSHERKYVYRFLPMSLGLFLAGALFCYYFVMPLVLDFLIGFNAWLGITLQPRLSEYISFILMLPVICLLYTSPSPRDS